MVFGTSSSGRENDFSPPPMGEGIKGRGNDFRGTLMKGEGEAQGSEIQRRNLRRSSSVAWDQ